jgi:hypothetical protein
MIKGKLLLCAEGVSIDVRSNNATIFNIIDQLNFKYLPVVFPKMIVYSVFEREEADPEVLEAELCICIDGNEVLNELVPINFQSKTRVRNTLTLGGLPITQPGKMEVFIYEKGKRTEKMLSYNIDVVVPKKPTVDKSEQ